MCRRVRISHASMVLLGIIVASVWAFAQGSNPTGPIARYTATTANVSGAPDSVRFDVLKWSTDADRDHMLAEWNLTAAPAKEETEARGRGGRGARGGGAPAAAAAEPGAAAAEPGAAAAGARGAGARGQRGAGGAAAQGRGAGAAGGGAAAAGGGAAAASGGGGRGRGRGAAAPPPAPKTPEGALAAAFQQAQTVGYLWTSEAAGYSLKYAYRIPQPDGSERIIFGTDRRLGAWNDLWKPTGGTPAADYEFSIVELHVNAKGVGEGKTSLTGKVGVDSAVKSIALEGYGGLPIVFKDVKRQAVK